MRVSHLTVALPLELMASQSAFVIRGCMSDRSAVWEDTTKHLLTLGT
jgi:hypothetical protein